MCIRDRFIILLFRIGSAIPVPFLEPEALRSMLGSSNNVFGYIDLMTGGNFSRATLFALSITPYINASIIIQLLTVAIDVYKRQSPAPTPTSSPATRCP